MYSLLSLGQQLYIHLEGWDGTTGYASYQNFVIGDETSNYQLTLGEFSGNVGK
ncbi:Angiopoietin-related protein 7 [Mizuhopecten yessoensis]|uniref:Angiopoietin-related protein 7 n=1 Tax=Mizuhopecten yessoensis TaxID=6573 RepID=A0A210PYD4_MIZYE|nr:Angiopoietin-related protein 7 [Mizuhopecten yessoensis]